MNKHDTHIIGNKHSIFTMNQYNENSMIILDNCILEPCLKDAKPEEKFQFYRHGYFCRDNKSDDLVFNLTVSIKAPYKKK